MLDPFIGFCKEGKLTVEHTLSLLWSATSIHFSEHFADYFLLSIEKNMLLTFLL